MESEPLAHHASEGGWYRGRRGLYRLRHFPSSEHEHLWPGEDAPVVINTSGGPPPDA